MKYRSTLYTRISCAFLFILILIRNRIRITYSNDDLIPAWLQYSDVVIFFIFIIIVLIDWKKMRLFYQNQEGVEEKKSYRRQTIINWIAISIVVIYIIGKLMRVISF